MTLFTCPIFVTGGSGKINRVHFYFQMDTKTFYGLKRAIIPVTDISDDENLSDGD